MKRLPGIIKVLTGLAVDFSILYLLFSTLSAACIVTGLIAAYVWLGGYLALLKNGAVGLRKLPVHQADQLNTARIQLISDIRTVSRIDLSNMKLFLVPGDEMNATAYGAGCVSVTRGMLDNADPIMLTAVLGHEASHLMHLDPEFSRLVFASVTLITASLSILSAAAAAVIFLIFLIFNFFRSWLGILCFKGTTSFTKGLFGFVQRCIVTIYRVVLGLASRHAEYRCDRFSAQLGYGVQLVHFLLMADAAETKAMTLADTIYRSHPPTPKRIARLEQQFHSQRKDLAKRNVD